MAFVMNGATEEARSIYLKWSIWRWLLEQSSAQSFPRFPLALLYRNISHIASYQGLTLIALLPWSPVSAINSNPLSVISKIFL
jgi:hypothetical protein